MYEHAVVPLYRSFARSDLCGPPANEAGARAFVDPGHIYDALLTGLAPGETGARPPPPPPPPRPARPPGCSPPL